MKAAFQRGRDVTGLTSRQNWFQYTQGGKKKIPGIHWPCRWGSWVAQGCRLKPFFKKK